MKKTKKHQTEIPESLRIVATGIREIELLSRHPNSDARIRRIAENCVSDIENNPKTWGGN